jgi:hypothetical protein
MVNCARHSCSPNAVNVLIGKRLVTICCYAQQQQIQQHGCEEITPAEVYKVEPECKNAFIAFVLRRKYIKLF